MSHSYPQLTQAQQHAYAMKAQRQFHWLGYSSARQAQILDTVKRLIAQRPNSYLARIWQEVYR